MTGSTGQYSLLKVNIILQNKNSVPIIVYRRTVVLSKPFHRHTISISGEAPVRIPKKGNMNPESYLMFLCVHQQIALTTELEKSK